MATSPVDDYLSTLPEDRRAWMQTLRETIRAAAPEAEEVITYKMPGFKSHGTFLVSYDAFKRHYSIFPASAGVIAAGGDELAPYLIGKGTISIPIGIAVPVELVTKIVRARVAENAGRQAG
ncbi:MAG TPA: DUF1801 domain-containing protein [Candidatus Limnocylindrales bacterium]|jgi:uncharacterized protein YdhG (YjbR/CyaY superfamily)